GTAAADRRSTYTRGRPGPLAAATARPPTRTAGKAGHRRTARAAPHQRAVRPAAPPWFPSPQPCARVRRQPAAPTTHPQACAVATSFTSDRQELNRRCPVRLGHFDLRGLCCLVPFHAAWRDDQGDTTGRRCGDA